MGATLLTERAGDTASGLTGSMRSAVHAASASAPTTVMLMRLRDIGIPQKMEGGWRAHGERATGAGELVPGGEREPRSVVGVGLVRHPAREVCVT
jgi:hypothetical protein